MSSLPPIASSGVANAASGAADSLAAANKKPADSDNRNLFIDLMAQANQDQIRSDQAIASLMSGEGQDVQQVVMEVVKAEMSFQIFMEVRNKIVDSYNELMRMQF